MDSDEVARQVAIADRNLADASLDGLSPDARTAMAHGATLALAAAALAALGYRVRRERHHERLLDSLQYSIGIDGARLRGLHKVRRTRNALSYEKLGETSDEEAGAIVDRVRELRAALMRWLANR